MRITSSAPTRIDLAGATTDIWPLYLFHDNSKTINIAIDQRAQVTIEQKSGMAIEIESKDLDMSMRLTSIDYVDEVEPGHPLELITQLLEFFRPQGGMSITTSCMSPAGSGLGGSSALAIALCGAFNFMVDSYYSREDLITIAKNIETKILKVPSGVQDYYPAMYGGLNSVLLDVIGETFMRHSHLLTHALEQRLVLVYSGQSRNSGVNNWEVMKSCIDQDEKVTGGLEGIQKATDDMEYALKTGNFQRVGDALLLEVEHRSSMCSTIVTDEMQEIINFGKEHGSKAAKVCGAGGGGCIAFWVPSSRDKMELIKKFREKGVQVIPFHADSEGLQVNSYQ